MVEAMSPHWSRQLACSDDCRVGAIAAGPRPVLLPPRGPGDLPDQLLQDVERLRTIRSSDGPDSTLAHDGDAEREWAGVPIGLLTLAAERIARQLEPVRTRQSLLSSYLREAAHPPEVRLAYAMVWLALGRYGAPGVPGLIARRRGRRTVAGTR